MSSPRGTLILVFLLLLLGGREFFRVHYSAKALEMGPPPLAGGALVYLGEGFPEQGVHHFSDDSTPRAVIQMTLPKTAFVLEKNPAMNSPLQSGEGLKLLFENSKPVEIKRFWSPAEMRMAFFIPLHPDRMDMRDWQALPGIGPGLALRIEKNRQKNGDFGCLENLIRVKGIGNRLIQRLKIYF